MAELHVLRVFTNEDGEWGNPLGVFLKGAEVPEEERQGVARELGFSETVFVDDAETGEVRIFAPETEFPFAGHPMVGTAWLLGQRGSPVDVLRPPAGEVAIRREDDTTFISGRPEWAPPFEAVELDDPAAVKAASARHPKDEVYFWAWIDEAAGTIRARCFAPAVGIEEDEATGSAAIWLCGSIGRPITIIQGNGSVMVARPLTDGRAEVGGRVAVHEVREL
jgi:predicted PhzF superfamily epimerase YddE/YHI9